MDILSLTVEAILTVLIGGFSALMGYKLIKNRLFEVITAQMDTYLAARINDLVEHPEVLAPVLNALAKEGFKTLGIEKAMAPKPLQIGSFKIPPEILQMAMPLVQKYLGQMTAEKGAEAAAGLFG